MAKYYNNIETEEESKRRKNLLSFTFLHFMNDLHSTSLPSVIPMLVQSIGLSMSGAGILNAIFGLTNIFAQPVKGVLGLPFGVPCSAPQVRASCPCLRLSARPLWQ